MGNWNRHFVRVGSDGNVGIYDAAQNRMIFLNTGNAVIFSQDNANLLSINYQHGVFNSYSNALMYMGAPSPVIASPASGPDNELFIGYTGGWRFNGLNTINGYTTTLNGINIISGTPDLRSGVTAADASAITIFSSTQSGTRYEVKARILATAGTSATYTISWTEGGVAQTVALTITAVDTEVHDNFVIAPDAGTNITAQITSLTSSTVNVDAIVSVLG